MNPRWLLLAAVGLAGAGALPVTELPVGQAVWRPAATVQTIDGPDGQAQSVTVDLYGFALAQPATVAVRLQSFAGLGVVLRDLDNPERPPIAILAPSQPWSGELAAGRYLVTVAGKGSNGPYLLAIATPPVALQTFAAPAEPAPGPAIRLVGRFALGGAEGLAIGPDGRWLATWQGEQATVHDLDAGASYAVPKAAGPVLRMAFSEDGWSVLTVTAAGARAATLPELVPYAEFTAQTRLRDAVPIAGQRVVALPGDAPAYVSSPQADDLATLPETRGASELVPGPGDLVGLVYANQMVQLFDAVQRQELGRARWPDAPAGLAVAADQTALLGTSATRTLRWAPGAPAAHEIAAGAVALACHPAGHLALAGTERVELVAPDGTVTGLEPAVAAVRLAFSAMGHRLAAQTATGEVIVWDTVSLLDPAAAGASEQLLAARTAYNNGLTAMQRQDYEVAAEQFKGSHDQLAALPASGEVAQFQVLVLLRLSQITYLQKDYASSLQWAEEYLVAVRKLPAGEFRQANEPQALYRRADALWELDRREEARAGYREALQAGLAGGPADDARGKLGP